MKRSGIIGIVLGALVLITVLVFGGCERIDAGHVGIKVNMTGGEKGVAKTEYVTGWVIYNSVASQIYEFPTFQQHPEYDAFTVPAKGGTIFTVHPQFNYSVNPGEVANMFQNLRQPLPNIEKGWMYTAMRMALREVTNTFTVDSILNNVSLYDASITEALNKHLHPYFTASQFTSGLEPDERLKATIAAKAQAIQESLQLQNEQTKIRVQAENDVIEAKRDSSVLIIGKLAEAKGITVVNEALKNSPQYVEKIKAERWDGKLPQYMMGSSTGMFLQLKQ
jgi:hypothetical protein